MLPPAAGPSCAPTLAGGRLDLPVAAGQEAFFFCEVMARWSPATSWAFNRTRTSLRRGFFTVHEARLVYHFKFRGFSRCCSRLKPMQEAYVSWFSVSFSTRIRQNMTKRCVLELRRLWRILAHPRWPSKSSRSVGRCVSCLRSLRRRWKPSRIKCFRP